MLCKFSLAASDLESMSNANCQLTNTCLRMTTDDLANEGSTTQKMVDAETTSDTEAALTTADNKTPSATRSGVSLRTADEPPTEVSCCSTITQNPNTAAYTSTSISTDQQLPKVTRSKSETPTEVLEFEKTSTVVMTAVDALKSTRVSEWSEGTILISVQTD